MAPLVITIINYTRWQHKAYHSSDQYWAVGRRAVLVSVHILANNALQAHHNNALGGVSTNGLSDILIIFFYK